MKLICLHEIVFYGFSVESINSVTYVWAMSEELSQQK